MQKDDMIMKAGIIHILDSSMGMPVLSDHQMEMGSDLGDFLKGHIEKFTENDDVKECQFADSSQAMELLKGCSPDNFVETSRRLADSCNL